MAILISAVVPVSRAAEQSSTTLKTINLRASPLTTLLGKFAGQVEFKVAKGWTVGPSVSAGFPFSWIGGALGFRTLGGGLKSHYYLSESTFEDSFYLGNEIAVSTIWLDREGTTKKGAESYHWEFLDIGGEFGYQWQFKTGFNLSTGLGLHYAAQMGGSEALSALFGRIAFQPSIQLELGYAL